MSDLFQTEYSFELPRGVINKDGTLHRKGTMRLATAADEIIPLKDPRVQQNPGYLSIIILSRVITNIEGLQAINTNVIESMFTADLSFLQDMYQRINNMDEMKIKTVCPHCNGEHEVSWPFFGE